MNGLVNPIDRFIFGLLARGILFRFGIFCELWKSDVRIVVFVRVG